MMTRRFAALFIPLLAATLGAAPQSAPPPAQAAQSTERFVGVWSGTWEGSGSGGGYELTLEQEKDKPMTGKVSVTGEPEYRAPLSTVAFEDKKMTATYAFPPEPSIQVVLVATFDGDAATGTWSARDSSGGELAAGTWTVKRIPRR